MPPRSGLRAVPAAEAGSPCSTFRNNVTIRRSFRFLKFDPLHCNGSEDRVTHLAFALSNRLLEQSYEVLGAYARTTFTKTRPSG